jgi:sortase A
MINPAFLLLALGLAEPRAPAPAFIHIDDRGRITARREPAPGRTWRRWRVLALVLALLAAWQLASAAWLPAKAWLAQLLIQRAWASALATGRAPPPWPWADTEPVARLVVPALNVDQIVLAHATGRSLAFGPGHLDGSPAPGAPGLSIVSGHRDTSFAFLAELKPGAGIGLQRSDGRWRAYRVRRVDIVDARRVRLPRIGDGPPRLMLTTCYPFDAILPGGPLRYVVLAEAAGGENAAIALALAGIGR